MFRYLLFVLPLIVQASLFELPYVVRSQAFFAKYKMCLIDCSFAIFYIYIPFENSIYLFCTIITVDTSIFYGSWPWYFDWGKECRMIFTQHELRTITIFIAYHHTWSIIVTLFYSLIYIRTDSYAEIPELGMTAISSGVWYLVVN